MFGVDPLSLIGTGLSAAGGVLQYFQAKEAAEWEKKNQARVESGLAGRMNDALNEQEVGYNKLKIGMERNNVLDRAALTNLSASNMMSARSSRDKLVGEATAIGNRMTNAYTSRADKIMSQFDTLGNQARKDLNQQYDSLGATTAQRMTDIGLGNSTVASTMQSGVTRQRADAVGRLEEGLSAQRIGAETALTGDTLSATERGLTNRFNTIAAGETDMQNLSRQANDAAYNLAAGQRAAGLSADEAYTTNRINMRSGLSGDVWNYAGGREYPLINTNPLLAVGNSVMNLAQMNTARKQAEAMQDMADAANNPLNQIFGGLSGGLTAYGLGRIPVAGK